MSDRDWDTPEGQAFLDNLVKEMMHKDFHIPIIGYAFDEKGRKINTKTVDRWEKGCRLCDKERPQAL